MTWDGTLDLYLTSLSSTYVNFLCTVFHQPRRSGFTSSNAPGVWASRWRSGGSVSGAVSLCSQPAPAEALAPGRDAPGPSRARGSGLWSKSRICCVGGIFFFFFSIDLERKQNLLHSVFFE